MARAVCAWRVLRGMNRTVSRIFAIVICLNSRCSVTADELNYHRSHDRNCHGSAVGKCILQHNRLLSV